MTNPYTPDRKPRIPTEAIIIAAVAISGLSVIVSGIAITIAILGGSQ